MTTPTTPQQGQEPPQAESTPSPSAQAPSPSPAPSPSAGVTPPPSVSPTILTPEQQQGADQRIKALEAHPALNDASHPEHAKVLAALKDAYRARYPEPEGAERVLPSASAAAAAVGVKLPNLPQPVADRWSDDAAADFIVGMSDMGVRGEVIQRILDRHVAEQITGGRAWTGPRSTDEASWREYLASEGLSKAQADRLIDWYKAMGS